MPLPVSALAGRLGLGPPPWIVAHRGASADAPENTLEALRLAIAQGADLAEVDLRLTADDHLVLCHDIDLKRVAGARLLVEHEPLARARAAYPDLAVLDEVLAVLPGDFPLNLELKRTTASPLAMVEALARILPGRGRLVVSSFDLQMLEQVTALLPGLAVAPLEREDPTRGLYAAQRLHAASLHISRRISSPALAARAALAHLPLLAYTIDDATEALALLASGVSGLFTNRPGDLRRELARRA